MRTRSRSTTVCFTPDLQAMFAIFICTKISHPKCIWSVSFTCLHALCLQDFFPPLHFRKMRGKISVKFLQRLEPKQIEKEPQSLTLYYSKCVQNYYSSLMRQLKNGDQGHARIFPICISWLQLPKEQCCLIISFFKSSGGFN